MAQKAIDSGTQGKKNKVFKRPIDLTGINKVPKLDKSPPSDLSCISEKRVEKVLAVSREFFVPENIFLLRFSTSALSTLGFFFLSYFYSAMFQIEYILNSLYFTFLSLKRNTSVIQDSCFFCFFFYVNCTIDFKQHKMTVYKF